MNAARTSAGAGGPAGHGPSIAAAALWSSSAGKQAALLSAEERALLATISSVVRFKKGATIYREGERADAVFNIIGGVVKTYRTSPERKEHIAAFLFPDDLIGLAEEGKYLNSAAAVTAVTAYRMPVPALETRLRKNPGLEFHVICKLCHDLRETQHHAFLLSEHGALAKTAIFLQMLESYHAARGEGSEEVYLPMSRSDIGEYLGLSLEAVSRSFRSLANRGIIAFRDRRHIKILNPDELGNLAS